MNAPTKIQLQNRWIPWLLIGFVFLYLGALILIPLGALAMGALSQGFGTLIALVQNPDVQAVVMLTLQVAITATIINGICGFVVAWVLVRTEFPGRRLISGLIDLPLVLSSVVAGYLFIILFGRSGPLASILDSLDLSIVFAVPGLIIATVFVTLPLMIRELMPIIAALDREQENAAATLGAGGWYTFYRITFPALRWGIIYGLTLTFARALGEFGAVLVIGGGIQGSTETATIYINNALYTRHYSEANWVALLLCVFSLALTLGIEYIRPHTENLSKKDS
jgi:sulfate transport system permease protein